MKLQSIKIRNFKSIIDVDIVNPNPFSVFVGSNSSGKSNIFEALEFLVSFDRNSFSEAQRINGGLSNFSNRNWWESETNYIKKDDDLDDSDENKHVFIDSKDILGVEFNIANGISPYVYIYKSFDLKHSKLENGEPYTGTRGRYLNLKGNDQYREHYEPLVIEKIDSPLFAQFIEWQSRIFVRNKDVEKFSYRDDGRLSTACGNLEKVLKRILKDQIKKEEIIEWLRLLVPGFENIEIKSEELSGSDNLLIYEKGTDKPFNRSLISDGTFNIIALLTAVYQSDEPQFLCIEEPENGLNPKVVQKLVSFFREQCRKKGHYIWLNTHSQTLVRELTTDEIIIVDKIDGETKIKQIRGEDMHGLPMDEALLTNAIGGGIPW